MAENTIVVNELLCFIRNNYGSGNRNELSAIVASFYTTEEVVAAKNSLFMLAGGLELEELPRQVNIGRRAKTSGG